MANLCVPHLPAGLERDAETVVMGTSMCAPCALFYWAAWSLTPTLTAPMAVTSVLKVAGGPTT